MASGFGVGAIIGSISNLLGTIWGGIENTLTRNETKRHNQAEEDLEQQQLEQNAALQREQEIADYESALALQQQQQEYELYMANTEMQRKIADYQAAGINLNTLEGSNASGLGGVSGSTKPNEVAPKSGTLNKDSNITQAILLEDLAYTAAKHPKELFDNLYKVGQYEANATAQLLRKGGEA